MIVTMSVEQLVHFLIRLYRYDYGFDVHSKVSEAATNILKASTVTITEVSATFTESEVTCVGVTVEESVEESVCRNLEDVDIHVVIKTGVKDENGEEVYDHYYGDDVMCDIEMKVL